MRAVDLCGEVWGQKVSTTCDSGWVNLELKTRMHWTQLETNTHQDHVIAHVFGATVLGWLIAGEAAHLLLDIGFLWTIYLDGEMNLLPQGVAIPELDADEPLSASKTERGVRRSTSPD